MPGSRSTLRWRRRCGGLRGLEHVAGDRLDDLGPVEQPPLLLGREAVLDVLVHEDLVERPPSLVLANHVPRYVLLRRASLEEE